MRYTYGWDALARSVDQGSQAARDSHPRCDASVGIEATASGSQYQSAVAGGYQTFDINVWATCPAGQVHAGTPAP